jgi:hypothetical protein
VIGLVSAGGAWADTKRVADPNDTRGALDLRAATHAHSGRRVVHTLATFASWPAGLLGPRTPNFLALALDTKGDRRPERIVVIVSGHGRLAAGVFTRAGRYVGSATASRPNAHTVRVSIRRARLGPAAGYRWAALSYFEGAGCSRGCADLAPNHGLVLHDLTAPRAFFHGSLFDVAPGTEYDLAFTVSDAGGSRLDSWRLEHRAFGETAWSPAVSGGTGGAKTYHRTSAQGDTDEFRLVALDRQGNRTTTRARTISVPIDDSNAALTYTSGWSTSVLNSAFLGTLHTAEDDSLPASVSYPFTGSFVGIVAPTGNSWIDTQGSVFVDDVHVGDYFPGELGEGSRQIVFTHGGLAPGAHTLRIDAASQFVPLDGIIVR